MKKEVDMLNNSLWSKIILFALPSVTKSIVQQLFNSADTAIIGKFGETGALAAVGTNGEIVAMFVSLSSGIWAVHISPTGNRNVLHKNNAISL